MVKMFEAKGVKSVNGKAVELKKDGDWDKYVELLDIVGSGQGVSDIAESDWHVKQLTELFDELSDDEKVELFVLTAEGASDGWYLNEIEFLAGLAGVVTFELVA